jgi:hypothetical protein
MIVGPITTPACTGVDGSGAATVTTALKVTGFVYGVYVQYVGDDPATTDVTVKTEGTSPMAPTYNILVATDLATDKLFLPRMDTHLATTGVAQSMNDALVPVDDKITVVVAQANTGDIISVWLFMLEV